MTGGMRFDGNLLRVLLYLI